jgi:pSer/pThr/pTyr-binding forkhead associated (FHA) protein
MAGHMVAMQLQNDGDPVAPHSLSPRELKSLLAAERAGEPFLAFRDQDASLGLFVLGREGRMITVGRGGETDLSIFWDGEVSSLHAELQRLGGEWTIVDDGLSMNGTFLNGERVSGRQRLRNADRIRIGRTILAYNAAQISPSGETATAGERPTLPALTDTQRRVLIALCRPYHDGGTFATPASNQQIAGEVFLSVNAVKMHLGTLFSRFELSELPQNQKRARLAEVVLQFGLISQRDLG